MAALSLDQGEVRPAPADSPSLPPPSSDQEEVEEGEVRPESVGSPPAPLSSGASNCTTAEPPQDCADAAEVVQAFACPVCGMDFHSLTAVHGHTRMHVRGAHQEQKEEEEKVEDLPPVKVWTVTGKRGRSVMAAERSSPAPSPGRKDEAEESSEGSKKQVTLKQTKQEPSEATKKATKKARPEEIKEEPKEEPNEKATHGEAGASPRESHAAGGFACATCGKVFTTPQGLGGHVAGHRNKEAAAAAGRREDGNAEKAAAKEHRCKVCGKEYATGVSLGGHMRKHRNKPAPAGLRLFGVNINIAR